MVQLPFQTKPQIITVQVIRDLLVMEGDIILGKKSEIGTKGIIKIGNHYRWPGGVIPYNITPGHPLTSDIIWAINHINEKSAIKLIQRTNETDYVTFLIGNNECMSHVGRTGGDQPIWISFGCSKGAIVHEILHTAGIYHEQSREDRDNYVVVNYGNIIPGLIHNFDKKIELGSFINEYDYASIMHYGKYDFSRNGLSTIDVRVPPGTTSTVIGQRDGLSEGDIRTIKLLYPQITHFVTPLKQINSLGWAFHWHDWNSDGKLDLIAIQQGVASKRPPFKNAIIHVLDGASNFKSHTQIETKFTDSWKYQPFFELVEWHKNGKKDLASILTRNTASQTYEVYIFPSSNNYSHHSDLRESKIPLSIGKGNSTLSDWDKDGELDLLTLYRGRTVSGKVEVHISSLLKHNSRMLIEVATPINNSDQDFTFADWDHDGKIDVLHFDKKPNPRDRTRIFLLRGSSSFKVAEEIITGFGITDRTWTFTVADLHAKNKLNLIGIKYKETNSGFVEINIQDYDY